ncbi:hypothetical protein [Sphingobium sp. YR768]|uniref:hypothetical protein n=1 Tax=Sphingobium sp. YR768 TaxID=1884365 RepID=UPI0008C05899|nr:hypothetical protein [Sphingobium sp. YR768]SES17440.1 hypothetical protein SAMN05518866_1512 [Sphingobium sp. YR768]
MTEFSNTPQPQTKPGIASAEDGLVVLDGPDGVAVTMTADAAQKTGTSLISAAELAEKQVADNGFKNDI